MAVVVAKGPSLWALAGVAGALGVALSWIQAPHGFFPLIFLALPLATLVADLAQTPTRAAVVGWAFGLGYFIPGLLWIGEAFFVEADRFAWLAPFAVTLLPAYLSLFWAAAFALARRLGGSPWAFAALWAIAEYARGQLFTGFPWGLFAYGWVDTPVAQAAAWVGPFGLNLLTILAAVALGRALIGTVTLGDGADAALVRPRMSGARRAAWGVGAVAMVGIGWTLGALRTPDGPTSLTDIEIRLVQPNVPQTEKWQPEFLQRNFDRLMTLSATDAGAEPPDLIIWPETAVTPWIVSEEDNRVALMSRLSGAPLVVGTQRLDETTGARDVYNSLFVLEPDGAIRATYDKHHLVPFGEFLPFQDVLESLGIFQLAGGRGGFSSGPGPKVVEVPGLLNFGALICYEAIFPDEMPRGADGGRPDVLVQITNDAWFGSSSGPYQHLAQAQMRAIEQGLPFLRAANTGVSAVIDPYGRVIQEIDLNIKDRLDAKIPYTTSETVYGVYGDVIFLVLAAMTLSILFASFKAVSSFRPEMRNREQV